MLPKPGALVRIVDDCRPGHPATNQIAIFEGLFPHHYGYVGCELHPVKGRRYASRVYSDAEYAADPALQTLPLITADSYTGPDWELPSGPFLLPVNNPRLRLADGSVIWGLECWWKEVPSDTNPAQ